MSSLIGEAGHTPLSILSKAQLIPSPVFQRGFFSTALKPGCHMPARTRGGGSAEGLCCGHGVEKGDGISHHAPTSTLSLLSGTLSFPFILLLTRGAQLILAHPTNSGEIHGNRKFVAASLP